MRTITLTLYKFNELSAKARHNAIELLCDVDFFEDTSELEMIHKVVNECYEFFENGEMFNENGELYQ